VIGTETRDLATPCPASPSLSIVITVVSGATALRRCLNALRPQCGPDTEILVPYDQWSMDVSSLEAEYPSVRFHRVTDLGLAASPLVPAHTHRLYDRRRAVGLALATGQLVAMTEDHAVPAPDWCVQIRTAHHQPYGAIGGAIENGVDAPLNWAWYYCDFGRYGRPLPAMPSEYVSDVNVAYKRAAVESTRDVWREAYHETSLHWALQAAGEVVFLDPRLIVYQHRPPMTLGAAWRERVEWGHVFAETRAAAAGRKRSVLYAAGTPTLPFLLAIRVYRHMRRQRRGVAQVARVLPLAFLLLTGWALGELRGYIAAIRKRG